MKSITIKFQHVMNREVVERELTAPKGMARYVELGKILDPFNLGFVDDVHLYEEDGSDLGIHKANLISDPDELTEWLIEI